jgi:hypothetical protein
MRQELSRLVPLAALVAFGCEAAESYSVDSGPLEGELVGDDDGILAATAPCPNLGVPGTPYKGFGADTTGGAGRTIYTVNTLSGADVSTGATTGSLANVIKKAVAAGGACIRFSVAGVIRPVAQPAGGNSLLRIAKSSAGNANITIDGFTAPSPGITILYQTLSSSRLMIDASNVIVRGLRIDGGNVTNGKPEPDDRGTTAISCGGSGGVTARNVVIANSSLRRAGDDTLNVGCNNVTISGNIISKRSTSIHPTMGFLFGVNMSMHHNVVDSISHRTPVIGYANRPVGQPNVDLRNNLMWERGPRGTSVTGKANANIVNNYYKARSGCDATCRRRAIILCGSKFPEDASGVCYAGAGGSVYLAGNVIAEGESSYVNAKRNRTSAWPIAAKYVVPTEGACAAAATTRAKAGARTSAWGLDAFDKTVLAAIPASLPGCN